MATKKSQVAGGERTRVFATIVYPDSVADGWRDRLTQNHVSALLSPLHDRDTNPDGSPKKDHYHLLVMFDGVKEQEQVDKMLDEVLGPNRLKGYETVNSTRGYARYLCHLDNPEKAQYSPGDVVAFGGADYDELVRLASDDRTMLAETFRYIKEQGFEYYDELINACLAEGRTEMFVLITEKRTMAVTAYLRAFSSRKQELERRRMARCGGLRRMTDK